MNTKMQKSASNELSPAKTKKVLKNPPAASDKTTPAKTSKAKASGLKKSAKQAVPTAQKLPPKKAVSSKKPKVSRQKVVRHSFTMPKGEYSMMVALKEKLVAAGITVKKSDLLRAGIKELSGLSHAELNKKISKLYLNV